MAGMPWIKVVVLGNRGVGKTSLVNNMAKCCLLSKEERAFVSETAEDPDKEVLFNPKTITYDDAIKMSIWEDNIAKYCRTPESADRLYSRLGRDASAVIICIDCVDPNPTAKHDDLITTMREHLPFNVKIYTLITQMDKIDRENVQKIVDTVQIADDELILGVTTKPNADGEDDAETVLEAIASDFVPKEQTSSNSWCTLL